MVNQHICMVKQWPFKYLKNIPESDFTNNSGFNKFQLALDIFRANYQKQSRKLRLSETEKLDLIKQQDGKSSISDAPIFLGDDIEVDHTDPLAIGGEDKIENLGIAHKDENRSKGSKIFIKKDYLL